MASATLINKVVPILYEDGQFLAVAKPAGIDVGGITPPPPGNDPGLVELLSETRSDLTRLDPVNRLSRYESGILVLAKNPGPAARLRASWKTGAVDQEYVAIVLGRLDKGHMNVGAEQSRERRGARVSRNKTSRNKTPAATKAVPEIGGAKTAIRLLKQGEKRALVRCRTNAPNTHVLKAQLRAVSLRVAGDHLNDPTPRRSRVEDTYLHLSRVTLSLPGSDKSLVLRSEPTDEPEPYLERERDVVRFLRAALARRLPLLASTDTNCFRLISGNVEDLPGIAVEKFGDVGLVQVHNERAADAELLNTLARWYRDTLGIKTLYAKSFIKSAARSGGRAGDFDQDVGEGDRPAKRSSLSLQGRRSAGAERGAGVRDKGRRAGGGDREHSSRRPVVRLDDLDAASGPIFGPAVADEMVVRENRLLFSIQPAAGQSVGLFLDQRDNRLRIREMAAGKDVLNLFAYTCGFSVAASAGGAKSTSSVDLSARHLEWGRRNFELNGIDLSADSPVGHADPGAPGEASPVLPRPEVPEILLPALRDQNDANGSDAGRETTDGGPPHKFFKSDSSEFLKRAKRQGRGFDIIIIDAPSFAHGRGRRESFSIETDLPKLVRAAGDVLRPGGTMLVSTNFRKLSHDGIRRRIREGAGDRKVRFAVPPLPVDFAMDKDHAKTVIAQFE